MKELYKNIGGNIRKFRIAQGMTQESLAAMADVHFKYIGALERGEYNASILVLYKISTSLGIPLEKLCSVAPEELTENEKIRQKITGVLANKDTSVLQWYFDVLAAAEKLQKKI